MPVDTSPATWTAVVAQCVRDCAAARNGHGRRWAAARAERALAAQAGGQLSSIDAGCVQAARRLGEWLRTAPACSRYGDATPAERDGRPA